MKEHSIHPFEPFRSSWKHRSLIWQMGKRDVIGRYRGSFLGLAWSFFHPLLMLFIYTFVFSVVFKARWGIGEDNSKTQFAIVLFVGLIVHSLFSECINRAPALIISNKNYVKKVVFPLEILPLVALSSALFHTLVSLAVLLVAILVLNFFIPWTAVLVPLVLFPLIVMTVGVAWFLAATGVFIRDIGQITGIITTVMLFLAPVFYPLSALPERYRSFLFINPLTFIIEETRQVLIFGNMPDWSAWCIYLGVSLLIAWMGFWWFQKTRKGFADVL
jgi:homopolymeric O-antigen transport system permease protein